jgi:hypothetical protein
VVMGVLAHCLSGLLDATGQPLSQPGSHFARLVLRLVGSSQKSYGKDSCCLDPGIGL